jgi:hypothetical protein
MYRKMDKIGTIASVFLFWMLIEISWSKPLNEYGDNLSAAKRFYIENLIRTSLSRERTYLDQRKELQKMEHAKGRLTQTELKNLVAKAMDRLSGTLEGTNTELTDHVSKAVGKKWGAADGFSETGEELAGLVSRETGTISENKESILNSRKGYNNFLRNDVIMRDYIDKGGVTAPKESSSLHDGTNGIDGEHKIYLPAELIFTFLLGGKTLK